MSLFSCCFKAAKDKNEEEDGSTIDRSKLGNNIAKDENENTTEGRKRKVIQRVLFGEEVDEQQFDPASSSNKTSKTATITNNTSNNNNKDEKSSSPPSPRSPKQLVATSSVASVGGHESSEEAGTSPVQGEAPFSPQQNNSNVVNEKQQQQQQQHQQQKQKSDSQPSTSTAATTSAAKRVIQTKKVKVNDDDDDSSDDDNDDDDQQQQQTNQQNKQNATEDLAPKILSVPPRDNGNDQRQKSLQIQPVSTATTTTTTAVQHVDPHSANSVIKKAANAVTIVRPALEDEGEPKVTDDASPYLVNQWFASHGVDHPEAVRWCQSTKSIRIRIRPATEDVGYSLSSNNQVLEYNNDFVPSTRKAEAFSDEDDEKEKSSSSSDDDDNGAGGADDSDAESDISIEEEVTDPHTGVKTVIKTTMRMNRKALAKLENGGITPKNGENDRKSRREARRLRKLQEPKPELPFRVTLMLFAPLAVGSFLFTRSDGYLVLTGTKQKAEKWPSLLVGGADKKKNAANVLEFGWITEEAPTPAMMMEDTATSFALNKKKGDSDSDSDDDN